MCLPRHQSLRSAVTLSPHECSFNHHESDVTSSSPCYRPARSENMKSWTRICQSLVSRSTWKNWPIHPHLWWCIEINYLLPKNICLIKKYLFRRQRGGEHAAVRVLPDEGLDPGVGELAVARHEEVPSRHQAEQHELGPGQHLLLLRHVHPQPHQPGREQRAGKVRKIFHSRFC